MCVAIFVKFFFTVIDTIAEKVIKRIVDHILKPISSLFQYIWSKYIWRRRNRIDPEPNAHDQEDPQDIQDQEELPSATVDEERETSNSKIEGQETSIDPNMPSTSGVSSIKAKVAIEEVEAVLHSDKFGTMVPNKRRRQRLRRKARDLEQEFDTKILELKKKRRALDEKHRSEKMALDEKHRREKMALDEKHRREKMDLDEEETQETETIISKMKRLVVNSATPSESSEEAQN